jgi:hypothetical protein
MKADGAIIRYDEQEKSGSIPLAILSVSIDYSFLSCIIHFIPHTLTTLRLSKQNVMRVLKSLDTKFRRAYCRQLWPTLAILG